MSEESTPPRQSYDVFDIGSLFRSSAIITFVIEIIAVVIMLGSLAVYALRDFFPGLEADLQNLMLLGGIAVVLIVFLAAFGVFVRFSRRISDAVIGPGIQHVRMDIPRVKMVIYVYAALVTIMGIIGAYIFYLIYKNILFPWAEAQVSLPLHLFSVALGALFIALLIQVIVAVVGRSQTKVLIEVLDADDSEFLE
ncbi:MAG: hypothetical protein RTU92_07350 [Candidatus Thorarchaeota archaeon]